MSGLYQKYCVEKVGGPTDPKAIYFVLRLDTDEEARAAARFYAAQIADVNPQLAHQLADLCNQVEQIHVEAINE